MAIFTIHTAKTTLSQLIARAESGEEIILARGANPVVRLVPIQPSSSKRQFGAMRGIVAVAPSFFDPLPADEISAWDQ